MRLGSRTALLVGLALAVACGGGDPGGPGRALVGDFALDGADGGTVYHLIDRSAPAGKRRVLESPVSRIGWNDRFVLVLPAGAAEDDGWMLVDTTSKLMVGPQGRERLEARPELASIAPLEPQVAWKTLGD